MGLNIDIARLTPRFLLQDKNGYALANAIERMFQIANEIIEHGLAQLSDVEKMEEWRLDERAWEMNVLWYDYSADIETKRSVIAGAQEYFDRLGTPYAINRAINDVYGSGNIEEWYEYGGDPFTFRVYTTNASALAEKRKKFLWLLDIVKNERSALENIYYGGESGTASLFTGTAIVGRQGYLQVRARNAEEE